MGKNAGNFLLGFWIGAVVGAAAALLKAPQSGDDTLRRLEERGIELKGRAQGGAGRLSEEARLRAQQASGSIKEQVTHVEERGRIVLSESARKAQQARLAAEERLRRSNSSSETPQSGI